jgi:predicted membrane-bound mannosyltransferase
MSALLRQRLDACNLGITKQHLAVDPMLKFYLRFND